MIELQYETWVYLKLESPQQYPSTGEREMQRIHPYFQLLPL